jgi:hypothetical protein
MPSKPSVQEWTDSRCSLGIMPEWREVLSSSASFALRWSSGSCRRSSRFNWSRSNAHSITDLSCSRECSCSKSAIPCSSETRASAGDQERGGNLLCRFRDARIAIRLVEPATCEQTRPSRLLERGLIRDRSALIPRLSLRFLRSFNDVRRGIPRIPLERVGGVEHVMEFALGATPSFLSSTVF